METIDSLLSANWRISSPEIRLQRRCPDKLLDTWGNGLEDDTKKYTQACLAWTSERNSGPDHGLQLTTNLLPRLLRFNARPSVLSSANL